MAYCADVSMPVAGIAMAAGNQGGRSPEEASASEVGPGGDPNPQRGERWRVVHSSGERVVTTLAELVRLLKEQPGARAFRVSA